MRVFQRNRHSYARSVDGYACRRSGGVDRQRGVAGVGGGVAVCAGAAGSGAGGGSVWQGARAQDRALVVGGQSGAGGAGA